MPKPTEFNPEPQFIKSEGPSDKRNGKAFVTRSKFKLNPIFPDKRNVIESCTPEPLVRLEWTNEERTEGELICRSINNSFLYTTEQKITTYVEWLDRTEAIEEVGERV